MTGPGIVMNARVHALEAGAANYGHCYSNLPDLPAGEVLRISSAAATIHCRLVWDLSDRFVSSDQVALDGLQRGVLGVEDGAPVQVSASTWHDLPVADSAALTVTRWSGPPADQTAGLADFLRSANYLLYPGLRFGYRPLAESGSGDYEITSVSAAGELVEVARVGTALAATVHRSRAVLDWPPTYEDLGGLDQTIALLRREIELPLRRPVELGRLGVNAPSGLLLYGPPGTGKSVLARAVAHHSGAEVRTVSGPEIVSWPRDQAEAALRAAFAREADAATHLVIIDDLDYLTPSRASPGASASLLGIMQQLLDDPRRPVVLATTSRRDEIDPAIRRLGRIGRVVPVPVPSTADREAILAVQTRELPLAIGPDPEREELLADLARRTAGFVGADLEALCHEAGRLALRRAFPIEVLESAEPEPADALQIRAEDWRAALTLVSPSAIGDLVSDVPPVGFDDVAGLDATVLQLRERLVLPLQRPQVFAEAGLQMERGLLLYGPPGTGKTLLARAIAHECDCRFISVRGPELLTKWFGESEQAVRDLFEKARATAPCVVFFDEIEAVAGVRSGGANDGGAADRVVNQLLAELDGLFELNQVSVIGATNSPERLDPAILRPGRLGLHIEVPLPDTEGRRRLFEIYLRSEALAEHLGSYAASTAGMSGADIAMVAREARLLALRRVRFERAEPVTDDDVAAALEVRRARPFARSELTVR